MRLPIALAVLCGLLAGCDGDADRYPAELRFPSRADPIVLQAPPVAPAAATPLGQLDAAIEAIPRQGGRLLHPADVGPADRGALDADLGELFGTPAEPKLPGVDAATLAEGSRLYRRHCTQCHGLGGDGRGPAGAWHAPHPRDFRNGIFKAASGHLGGKPSLERIRQTLRAGVPGTAMQPFHLLPDADIAALAEYVRFLARRGEVEALGLRAALDPDVEAESFGGLAESVAAAWRAAEVPLPSPGDGPGDADAVRRGHALFLGAGGCAGCHADYGRAPQYRYDVWGAVGRVPDLTRGEHRWGKSAADHARAIRHGIPGAGMPGTALLDADVRDLAAFVDCLPKPPRLPAAVRSRVYEQPAPAGERLEP